MLSPGSCRSSSRRPRSRRRFRTFGPGTDPVPARSDPAKHSSRHGSSILRIQHGRCSKPSVGLCWRPLDSTLWHRVRLALSSSFGAHSFAGFRTRFSRLTRVQRRRSNEHFLRRCIASGLFESVRHLNAFVSSRELHRQRYRKPRN